MIGTQNLDLLRNVFLHILDIRVDFEKAAITGDVTAQTEAEFSAQIAGYQNGDACSTEVPVLFKNVPALNAAWFAGWQAANSVDAVDDDDIGNEVHEEYWPEEADEVRESGPLINDEVHEFVFSVAAGSLELEIWDVASGYSWRLVDGSGRTHRDCSDRFETYGAALKNGLNTCV